MKQSLLFIILIFSIHCFAELRIPTNLTSSNKTAMIEILGLGTAPKIIGDPFPLGGYSGFEFGLSTEILTTSAIAKMGSQTSTQEQTSIYTFNFGKGIYSNIDTYIHFSFLGQSENLSQFGAQFRWGIYQSQYLPIYASVILSGSNTNINNLVLISNQAMDLVFGFKSGDITLFFGGGFINAQGTFSGGTGGVTVSGETEKSSVFDSRFISGVNIKFDNVFAALELDRFTDPVYSAKIGFRF